MKDEHKHCCGKANSHSGAGCCSTHKVEHNSGKSCGCNHTHGDCGSHDHHRHHHGAEGGQCCSHGGHTASHTNCGQSACGCEHHHGSSKEMIFQFGISAAAFAAGLVCSVFFSGITVFRFYGIEVSLAIIFFAAAWAAAGFNVVLESVKNIFRGKIFDENFLMTTATLGAFILGEWSEGAAVMLFYNLGELVQHSAVEKSRRSIISLMDLRPDFARICKGANEEQIVKPEEVPIGSLIIVKPGEKIPLDGIIETGFAELDTSSMTGESIPRQAEAGSKVLAGFVNLNGVITVKTSADLKNSAASKMLELIENAQNGKAKTEKFITSFARVYTPIVTVAAVLLSILPPVFNAVFFSIPIIGFSSFAPWISRGLVFLVISCPCAFVISVPLGYFGGIGGAAKHGILIKGADYIDALARTKAAVFDKTGTLTQGVLKVMTLIPAFGIDKDKLLKITAAAELNSHHPIAKALRECAALNLSEEEYENLKSAALQNYTETAGQGITAEYNGSMIVTGKNTFVSRISKQDIPMAGDEIGGTQIYTCYGGKYLGCIILTDVIKDDSRQAVLELEKLGVERIHMLSGDNEKSARFTAEALGIKHYCASLLPHEKVSRFEDICAEVKASNKKAAIIFAGDGINDAPVLARADAGIAMGGIGSDAAIEAADIVLMNDSPVLIAEGIKLARFTKKIVWENICLAFSIKLGFLLLGALGVAGLWAAVFADVGVALLAVVNSLRPIRK